MSTTEKGIVSDIARGVDWLDDGNNNFTRLRRMVNEQFGPKPASFSGTTYAYFGGTGWNGSAWTSVADGTIALTDNATNYVERTAAGVVSANTSSFTASKIPMAVVTTLSGAITAISERRQEQVPTAGGTGDALTSDGLDQFAPTTSAELAGVISDETGSGALVFASAPTLTNPVVGTQTEGDNSTKAASTAYADLKISKSFVDAKGDLITATADNTPARLAVGSNGKALIADSGQSTGLAWGYPAQWYMFACSDETTAITTGTAKLTFRLPACTVLAVRASVNTAPTGSTIIIDINESGTTILSTKLSIDASEKTSVTAASAAVISDASIADDAEITIDFDQVGSTVAGAGVKVYLLIRPT